MPSFATLESEIQRLGQTLFAQVRARQAKSAGWWQAKLMASAIADPRLRIKLFRFVDVLPALRNNDEVARHIKEYFKDSEDNVPTFLSWGASLASFGSIAKAAAAMTARKSVEEMARSFIAAQTPKEAIKAVVGFRKKRLTFTLDALGEAVVSEPEADAYLAGYLKMLEALAKEQASWKQDPQVDLHPRGSLPRINLSVKLSSLYSQLDPIDPQTAKRGVERRLIPLLHRAREVGAFVNIDMEDYRLKDLTLDLFRAVATSAEFKDWPDLGIVIQAYLKESARDLKHLIRWVAARNVPVTVRLVKGAYWDYETVIARQNGWSIPVYTEKAATDANYESCTRLLLDAYPFIETAIASHNIRSIAHALAYAQAKQLPTNAYEFQALYGMADPLKEALIEQGMRVRVYTPYGELLPGMAYLVRRLLENTANDSFLRQGFVEGVSVEKLLQDPSSAIAETVSDEKAPKAGSTFKNEPEAALHDPGARIAFATALSEVSARLGATYHPIIDGQQHPGNAGIFASVNPSQLDQVVGNVSFASIEQANRAIGSAKNAFYVWRDRPLQERAAILRKAAELMRIRRFELAAWIVYEAAKTWREADGDVAEAIDFLEYYAQQAEQLMRGNRRIPVPGEIDEDLYQPRGIAAIIAPWNFPLAILTGMTAAALATGNCALMKPAEQTPVIAALLHALLLEAGIPPNVLHYLPGVGETLGAHLVTHPDIHLIAFTGSKAVGLAIHAAAAQTRQGMQGVKKVICEMGGKNAIVVDADADLDEAVLGVVHSAFSYAGQKCSACSRTIVVGDAYQPFVERIQSAVESLKVAPATEPSAQVPPVIDQASQLRILEAIERGKKEAVLLTQVAVPPELKGSFVPPTVFKDVPTQATIAQEEIFGPVLCVMQAGSFEEAIKLSLDVPYALTGGIYSRSPANVAFARREFRVGNLYINRGIVGAKVARHPFGGFKFSGIGSKAGGPDYLLQFVEPRTITENTLRRGFADDEAS